MRVTTDRTSLSLDLTQLFVVFSRSRRFVRLTARLAPLGQIPALIEQIADWKNEAVVVYCHHGIRSMHAINFLTQAGFTNLANLTGGIDAWSREVDPHMPRY